MTTFGITRSFNEVDLLEYSVRRMARQVDHIIIGDNSTDGGREALERLVADGLPITLLEDKKLNWQQREVMTEYAPLAARWVPSGCARSTSTKRGCRVTLTASPIR